MAPSLSSLRATRATGYGKRAVHTPNRAAIGQAPLPVGLVTSLFAVVDPFVDQQNISPPPKPSAVTMTQEAIARLPQCESAVPDVAPAVSSPLLNSAQAGNASGSVSTDHSELRDPQQKSRDADTSASGFGYELSGHGKESIWKSLKEDAGGRCLAYCC